MMIFCGWLVEGVKLIFVDTHVRRIAGRIQFPFYHNADLNDAELTEVIRRFSENYNLTARQRQIDMALREIGFVCSTNKCLHGMNGNRYIFFTVFARMKKSNRLKRSNVRYGFSPCYPSVLFTIISQCAPF